MVEGEVVVGPGVVERAQAAHGLLIAIPLPVILVQEHDVLEQVRQAGLARLGFVARAGQDRSGVGHHAAKFRRGNHHHVQPVGQSPGFDGVGEKTGSGVSGSMSSRRKRSECEQEKRGSKTKPGLGHPVTSEIPWTLNYRMFESTTCRAGVRKGAAGVNCWQKEWRALRGSN